jgi:hypothetical protein
MPGGARTPPRLVSQAAGNSRPGAGTRVPPPHHGRCLVAGLRQPYLDEPGSVVHRGLPGGHLPGAVRGRRDAARSGNSHGCPSGRLRVSLAWHATNGPWSRHRPKVPMRVESSRAAAARRCRGSHAMGRRARVGGGFPQRGVLPPCPTLPSWRGAVGPSSRIRWPASGQAASPFSADRRQGKGGGAGLITGVAVRRRGSRGAAAGRFAGVPRREWGWAAR